MTKTEIICKVCDNNYNKNRRKRVKCSSCDYDQCQQCVKRYLLTIRQIESKCMNCNVEWEWKFLKENLPRTYLEGEYKEEQKKKIFDQERQHFPELMGDIEGYKRRKKLMEESHISTDKLQETRKIKDQIMTQRQIYSREIKEEMICPCCIKKQCGQKVEEGVYKQVSKNYKREEEIIVCWKCKKSICQHCLSVREKEGEEHRCVQKNENKVVQLDQQIEELDKKKKGLQLENKEILQRLRDSQMQNNGQEQIQRNYYIHCPQKECNGYIDNKKDRCGVCEIRICRRCNEEERDDHKCRRENVESAKKIRSQCKQCPGCKTQIYKIEGCNDMFCVICKISFNWGTGEKTERTGNPHYYEYLRQRNIGEIQNNVELNQMLQEIQNHNNYDLLVAGERIEENIRKYLDKEGEEYKKIMEKHEEISHIQIVKMGEIQRKIRYTSNKEDCMKYLTNQIGIEQLMSLIQTNRKKREKLRNFEQILVAYVEVCKIQLNQISEDKNKENIIDNLDIIIRFKDYIKSQIEETKKLYNSRMKIL